MAANRSPDRDDPLIDEVRAARQALADEFNDDVDRLCDHLKSLDEQYHAKIRKPPERAEAFVESVQRYHATIIDICTQSVRDLLKWDINPQAPNVLQRKRFDALLAYFLDDAGWRRSAEHGSLPAEVMGYPIEAVREHVVKLARARDVARHIAQLVVRVQKSAGQAMEAEAVEFIRRDLRALREAAIQVRDACPLQGMPVIDPATWKQYYADPLARAMDQLDQLVKR